MFNGKERDEETGLSYYGASYYDARVSNWLSVDPIALYDPVKEDEHYIKGEHNGGYFNPRNTSVYGYCYQSPVTYIDPNGKQIMVGLEMAKKAVKYIIPSKNTDGKIEVDNTAQGLTHYYTGNGSNVELGTNTKRSIQSNPDVKALTDIVKKGGGEFKDFNVDSKSDRFGVDFEGDSFHLGSMSLSWETIDNEDGTLTTHFTVDDKGFVDPNYVGEFIGNGLEKAGINIESLQPDNGGPNLELKGGQPYDYNEVKWSETYSKKEQKDVR